MPGRLNKIKLPTPYPTATSIAIEQNRNTAKVRSRKNLLSKKTKHFTMRVIKILRFSSKLLINKTLIGEPLCTYHRQQLCALERGNKSRACGYK